MTTTDTTSNNTTETNDTVNPFTEEAFQWMIGKNSIPGAFPPILYCGPQTVVDIFEAIGRPIELEEAKRLVQPDGPVQTCVLTKKEFQPVAYVPYCPGGLYKQIEGGATLLTARLPFGGQFHFINGEPKPVSGSVFHYEEATQTYSLASASPLVILARTFKKESKEMKWGVPLAEIETVLAKKEEKNKIHEAARDLVSLYLRKDTRLNPVAQTIEKVEKANGKPIVSKYAKKRLKKKVAVTTEE